jgi:hypothetical protein
MKVKELIKKLVDTDMDSEVVIVVEDVFWKSGDRIESGDELEVIEVRGFHSKREFCRIFSRP